MKARKILRGEIERKEEGDRVTTQNNSTAGTFFLISKSNIECFVLVPSAPGKKRRPSNNPVASLSLDWSGGEGVQEIFTSPKITMDL